jgi:hypothetical protein
MPFGSSRLNDQHVITDEGSLAEMLLLAAH